jgi:hypothetical protein
MKLKVPAEKKSANFFLEAAAESALQLRELKLCGIEFGDLTASQVFLLEGFIDSYTSLKSIRFGALEAYSQ